MKDLDKKIQDALRQQDAELFAEFGGEPSVFEMLLETCRGRNWWLNLLGMFWTLVFLVAGIVAAVKFFQTEELRGMLMWAAIFLFCMTTVAMFKMWYWMEMQRNAVTREIKRVELQIARLAERVKQ